MNTFPMVSHKPFRRLQPLSLFAQLINHHVNGCLEVVSESTSWLIYFDHGQLCFATNSTEPFERLDRHLHRLNQIPTLTRETSTQLRSRFENTSESHSTSSADYQAIDWLVEQHSLDLAQATALIGSLAKEVIESFLSITEGMYEITDRQHFTTYPNLCKLDLRPIVEYCHNQRQQPLSRTSPKAKVQRPDALADSTNRAASTVETQFTRQVRSAATNRFQSVPSDASKPRYTIACIDDILYSVKSWTFLKD
ncbi:DUF4388 domain-containing protein [Phormidesmis priestleyi]